MTVLSLAVFTSVISTVLFKLELRFRETLRLAEIPIEPMQAFLFGALISPTDPIALLGMLQRGTGAQADLKLQPSWEVFFQPWSQESDFPVAFRRVHWSS